MLVSDLVTKVFINVKGKDPSKSPTSGDKNWKKYLSKINDKLRAWASDSEYIWDSLLSVDVVLNKNGDVYEVPADNCRAVRAYIIKPDKTRFECDIIQAKNRFKASGAYIFSNSPSKLKFTEDVTVQEDDLVAIDYIAFPTEVKNASDQIYCDSYEWLAYAVAAEIVRTDPQMNEEFANLIGLAKVEYDKMTELALKPGRSEISLDYPRIS